MILGLDPLYIILLVIGAVAIGLGVMGFAMYKMIALLTAILASLTTIYAVLTRPSTQPPFTQSLIEQVEAKVAELRLASKDASPAIVAELAEAVATLQHVSVPLERQATQSIERKVIEVK